MALEIGVAYLSIIPSTRGMIREIKRSLNEDGNRVARQAGRDMGQSLGKGLGDGFERVNPLEGVEAQVNKAKAAANDAAKEMELARERAEKAARKAKIAEVEYHEAVDKSGANTARAMRALDKYREAKRQSGLEGGRYLEALSREQLAAENARREADGLAQSKRELAEANELASRSFQTLGERFRSWRRGAGSGPKLQVDVDGTTLERRMAELTNSISARHKITVRVDYNRGALNRMRGMVSRAFSTAPVRHFENAATGAANAVANVFSKIASQVPGTWVILGTLGAIGAITFAPLIASAGQLINLLALIPAVASGALAAIGGIVAGSLGIFKALGAANKAAAASGGGGAGDAGIKQQKAITKAQDQAARTAEQGAKRVAKAERALADAQKASRRAQEDLNDARAQAIRDLEDMNARLAESSLDEEGAILAVRRAYDDLWNTTSDPDASMLDRQEANLRYRQSINSLERIRRENERLRADAAKANAEGVEGSDEVVAAKERVEDATRAVADAEEDLADTVKDVARANADAQDAIQDAMAGTGAGAVAAAGGVDEFAEAMADLSPSARKFVETVLGLKGAWTEFRLATQEALFKDLGPGLQRFADTYFPILTTGLVGFNEEFNRFFLNVMDRMNSEEIQTVWNNFFENSKAGLGPMLDGFEKLGEAFAKISEIGSRSFPRIGEAIDGWADGIVKFIDANPDRIHGWIEDGITAFGKLKTTAYEVLRIIKNIFAPGTEEGQEMWDKINDTLKSWADTIGKPENQEALLSFFEDAVVVAQLLKETVESIAGLVRRFKGISDENEKPTKNPLEMAKPSRVGKGGVIQQLSDEEIAAHHDEFRKRTGREPGLGPAFGAMFGKIGDRFMSFFDASGADSPGGPNIVGGEMGEHYRRRQEERRVKPAGLLSEAAAAQVREGGGVGEYKPHSSPSGGAKFQGENRKLDSSSVSAAMPDPTMMESIKLKFDEMSNGLRATYDTNIVPLFDGFNVKVGEVRDWFGTKASEISTAWSDMSTRVQTWYDTSVKPTWDRFTADGTIMGDGWNVVTSLMSGDWGSLSDNITIFTDNHITPALDRLRGWLDTVHEKFGDVKDGIGKKWDELRGLTARPINFVIKDVWNNGLRKGWNAVASLLGMEGMGEMAPIPGYRTGGAVFGPGTATSDSILARLSAGEHVLTADDVRAIGGHKTIYALRALIKRGIPFTWDQVSGLAKRNRSAIADAAAGRGDLGLPGYRRGGAVEPRPAWMDQLERGHAFARAQDGKPYLAGNQFPHGADCSGFMSAVAGVITDDNPRAHWTTVAFPASQAGSVVAAGQNWVGGLSQGMSIGMSGGPQSGGQMGHTAGTLSGVGPYSAVNIESGGGHGRVAYGGPAAGADHGQFNSRYHLAIGADGAFESAGGPSPEQQRALIWKKFQEILSGAMDGIGDSIPSLFPVPPVHNGVPGEAFDRTREGAFDKAKELVDGLSETLRSVYDRAKEVKDIVVNTVSGLWSSTGGRLTSYFRDTGGFIPTGQSIVRNETGRPEAVLNWQQLDRIKWLMADAASFASQFAELAPIAEALSNAAMDVTRWQDMSAQERWSPYQQQVLRLVKDIRQIATDHGFGPEAEAIAGPIVDSIENLDWDFVDARMSKTLAEVEKVGTDAGKAWVDDAASVFGVSGLTSKIDAWDKFGKALSGEMQTSPSVPSASAVTGSGYSLQSATRASEVDMPDFDSLSPGGGASGGDAGGVKGVVRAEFAKHGWDKEPFWSATDWIVNKESSWNPSAQNPTSTAFGLFQFLDSTWAGVGASKTSDPALQAAAGAKYIKNRYGDPVKAKAFWEQNGWYDRGGVLKPGTTLAQNDSGKDELILTNEQWRNAARTAVEVNRMAELSTVSVAPGRVSGGDTININALDLPGAERMFRLREAQKAQRFVGVR